MHSFLLWLRKNVLSAQGALLQALARRDHLQFVEAPKLQREYMEKIGEVEREALEKELDASLLEKKKKLIQTCLNRREEPNLQEIDEQIAKEREELLKQAGLRQVPEDGPRLSPEEEAKLQEMYKALVKDFHPSIHPGLTDTQKELFDKALEAYQHQDLEMLTVIDEMLRGDQESLSIPIPIELGGEKDPVEEAKKLAAFLSEDYTLAAEIYPCFDALEEEKILQETALSYHRQCKEVLEEIEAMLRKFPFSARETLEDEQMCEAYLRQVRSRIAQADAEIAELEKAIASMTGENAHE